MTTDHASPHFGHWCLGVLFALLALAAGAISLSLNITFGLQTSVIAALIFALSDGAKILLPMVSAALGRWDLRRRMAWGVAVAISVTAALSSLLESEAQRLKDSEAASQLARDARAGIDRARQDLAAIKEPLSATALRSLLDEATTRADREAARGGCGPRCEAARAEAAQLVARLGMAERREELQTQLSDPKRAAKTNPETALGATDTLAALTGGDRARIATLTSIAISIAMLIILELLATFSGDAAAVLRRAWSARPVHATPPQSEKPAPADAVPAKPAKAVANRAYYLGRLEREFPALAARTRTGELSVYRASIEAGLRKPPARNWTQPDAYRPKPLPSALQQTANRASPTKTLRLAASPK
ncbi:MAG: hypothetical protein ACFCUR_03420 [Rhodomicrobiaceae bacterium]